MDFWKYSNKIIKTRKPNYDWITLRGTIHHNAWLNNQTEFTVFSTLYHIKNQHIRLYIGSKFLRVQMQPVLFSRSSANCSICWVGSQYDSTLEYHTTTGSISCTTWKQVEQVFYAFALHATKLRIQNWIQYSFNLTTWSILKLVCI